MLDPDFDEAVLVDDTQRTYFDWTGFAQQDAGEGDIDVTGEEIVCTLDATEGPPGADRDLTFYMPYEFGLNLTAAVRTAMDTLLGTNPEIQYFTLEPVTNLGAFDAVNFCGPQNAGLLYGYDPDDPPWGPADTGVETGGQFGTVGEEPQSYEVDGSPVDIAVRLVTDWYVDSAWGPTSTGGGDLGLGPHAAFGQLGGGGRPAFLLRPAAHTWPGQDAGNTANRIFWTIDDVAGDVSHRVAGIWGHVNGNALVKVRGWVRIRHPQWMCVL